MDTKHTPGPWEIAAGSTYSTHTVVIIRTVDGLGEIIGAVCNDKPELVGEANAHLIAAAPELLAALKGIRKLVDDRVLVQNTDGEEGWIVKQLPIVYLSLRAVVDAIAKAEGRKA